MCHSLICQKETNRKKSKWGDFLHLTSCHGNNTDDDDDDDDDVVDADNNSNEKKVRNRC